MQNWRGVIKTKVLTVPAWTQALHYDFSS